MSRTCRFVIDAKNALTEKLHQGDEPASAAKVAICSSVQSNCQPSGIACRPPARPPPSEAA